MSTEKELLIALNKFEWTQDYLANIPTHLISPLTDKLMGLYNDVTVGLFVGKFEGKAAAFVDNLYFLLYHQHQVKELFAHPKNFEFKPIPGLGPRNIWDIFPEISYQEIFKMYGVTERSVAGCIELAKIRIAEKIEAMPEVIEAQLWRKRIRDSALNTKQSSSLVLSYPLPDGIEYWEPKK